MWGKHAYHCTHTLAGTHCRYCRHNKKGSNRWFKRLKDERKEREGETKEQKRGRENENSTKKEKAYLSISRRRRRSSFCVEQKNIFMEILVRQVSFATNVVKNFETILIKQYPTEYHTNIYGSLSAWPDLCKTIATFAKCPNVFGQYFAGLFRICQTFDPSLAKMLCYWIYFHSCK